ncbi:metalloregulator ArsR/SmtB family transcription factor [Agromyces sp. NPDC004153]
MTDSPRPAQRVAETSLQAIVDALSSPVRREILWLVWDAERTAGEIAASFDLTAGTISSHLAALRAAGLLAQRRDGTFRWYRADRAAMRAVLPLLGSADDKWNVADDIPEGALARAGVEQWVTVAVDVPLAREHAFASFVDGARFSDFLGVPVSIEDGRFSTRLEWGTVVRGRYEVVAPPDLIAMRWDFDDEAVPVPGRQLVGYLRFRPERNGCRIEVHQEALDAGQAQFLSVAWSLVLGRLVEHVGRGGGVHRRRSSRPKHTGSDPAPGR